MAEADRAVSLILTQGSRSQPVYYTADNLYCFFDTLMLDSILSLSSDYQPEDAVQSHSNALSETVLSPCIGALKSSLGYCRNPCLVSRNRRWCNG